MDDASEIIRREIPDIQQIVQTECWLEGERCGHSVSRHDPAVQGRVADVILKGAGAYLRRKHLRTDRP
jgi:hypothetical protein